MARFIISLVTAALLATGIALPAAAELRLVMFEEKGCTYCEMWDRQIAPIYPKTPEGRAAPLQRVDVNATVPADLRLESRPRFTPTFVLVRDGVELGRVEGYPGEAFFWGLLGMMLTERAGVSLTPAQEQKIAADG